MNFPTFNDIKFVEEDGFLSASMQMYHDDMNQTLRNGLSDNGWTTPPITGTNLVAIAPNMPDGTLWYESIYSAVVEVITIQKKRQTNILIRSPAWDSNIIIPTSIKVRKRVMF